MWNSYCFSWINVDLIRSNEFPTQKVSNPQKFKQKPRPSAEKTLKREIGACNHRRTKRPSSNIPAIGGRGRPRVSIFPETRFNRHKKVVCVRLRAAGRAGTNGDKALTRLTPAFILFCFVLGVWRGGGRGGKTPLRFVRSHLWKRKRVSVFSKALLTHTILITFV